MWIQYVGLISALMFSLIIKPYVLYKDIDYTIKEMFSCFWTCTKVALLSMLIITPILSLGNSFEESLLKMIMSFIAVILSSWMMMDKVMKKKCVALMKSKTKTFRC